nr:hypothetical protein BgiMline_008028 [Biomphalaria glabrata]
MDRVWGSRHNCPLEWRLCPSEMIERMSAPDKDGDVFPRGSDPERHLPWIPVNYTITSGQRAATLSRREREGRGGK